MYHIGAKGGRLTKPTDEIRKPNGLCFSPDYRAVRLGDVDAIDPV